MLHVRREINRLIDYKDRQRQKVEVELNKLKEQKEQLQSQISEKKIAMQDNREEHKIINKDFYHKLKNSVVPAKQFRHREFYLEKCDASLNKLEDEYNILLGEVHQVSLFIQESNEQLKALIVKQEKYKYLLESEIKG